MSRSDTKNLLIALLAGTLIWLVSSRTAEARPDGGGGDSDRGMIAVTGTYGSGASALYLFDTKTRHLAVYRLENGRALDFVAARDCAHDFLLETYNDQSPGSMKPSSLRRSWEDFNRKSAGLPDSVPQDGTAPDSNAGGAGEDSKTKKNVLPPPEGGKGGAPQDGERKN